MTNETRPAEALQPPPGREIQGVFSSKPDPTKTQEGAGEQRKVRVAVQGEYREAR